MSAGAETLRKARALIENGWCQHVFTMIGASGICFCTVGALDDTNANLDEFNAAVQALKVANNIKSSLFTWNDARGRTQAEVLAAFDKAIELAEVQP